MVHFLRSRGVSAHLGTSPTWTSALDPETLPHSWFAESFIYCDLASVTLYAVPVVLVCDPSFILVHVVCEDKHVQGVEYLG